MQQFDLETNLRLHLFFFHIDSLGLDLSCLGCDCADFHFLSCCRSPSWTSSWTDTAWRCPRWLTAWWATRSSSWNTTRLSRPLNPPTPGSVTTLPSGTWRPGSTSNLRRWDLSASPLELEIFSSPLHPSCLSSRDPSQQRVKKWGFSLEEALKDPAGRDQFLKFLESEFSSENLRWALLIKGKMKLTINRPGQRSAWFDLLLFSVTELAVLSHCDSSHESQRQELDHWITHQIFCTH